MFQLIGKILNIKGLFFIIILVLHSSSISLASSKIKENLFKPQKLIISSSNFQSDSSILLTILATSDLHGWVDHKLVYPRRNKGLIYLSRKIEKLRMEYPDLILLDGGDTFWGSPSSSYFLKKDKKNQVLPIIQLMNYLNYDIAVVGNHEFEVDLERLKGIFRNSNFTWIAANIKLQLDESQWLPPYKILNRSGIKIGILGLTTPGIPMWSDKEKIKGLVFEDMLKTATYWANYLKKVEKVDVLIGLFHSGESFRYDKKIAMLNSVYIPNMSGVIADKVGEFDLIISGHAHKTFPKRNISKLIRYPIPVISPGSHGKGISFIQIKLKDIKNKWVPFETNYSFIRSGTKPTKMSKSLELKLKEVKQHFLGKATVVFTKTPRKREFENCGVELTLGALNKKNNNSILLLSAGNWSWKSVRKNSPGKVISRTDLFKWIKYDNEYVQVKVFGKQLEILLNAFLKKKKKRKYRNHSLLVPAESQLILMSSDGDWNWMMNKENKWLEPKKSYLIWLSKYHWNGGSGVVKRAIIKPEQLNKKYDLKIRDQVFSYLSSPFYSLPDSCKRFLRKENVRLSSK